MWWKLIVAYIKKVIKHLIFAAMCALITWAVFPMLSVAVLSLMYAITSLRLLFIILAVLPTPRLKPMTSLWWSFITLRYMSDVILLLSATPYIQSILSIVVLFQAFEAVVPTRYSLFHLLFNSRARQAFIHELSSPNVRLGTNFEEFAMKPEELDALRIRQKTAISHLPKALKQLHATQKDSPEAGNHYTHYCTTLLGNQKKALEKYLEIKSGISEGCCPMTLKEVNDPESNLSDFVILEKHYSQDNTYYVAPGATDVFIISEGLGEGQNGLQPFMNQSRIDVIIHPKNRDKLKCPETSPHFYRYVHYPLEFIEDHPLALALCEAIEAFNASLGLQHNNSIAAHPSALFRQPSKPQDSEQPVNPIAARLELEKALQDGMSDDELARILATYAF